MTSNWEDFIEFVNDKFGSLSNFAKILTGSFQTFQGLRNTNDHQKIYELKLKAEVIDFKIKDVEISDFDRKVILAGMDYFLFVEDYKNVSAVLREKGISEPYYSAVKRGKIKRKNLAFENLWTKLEL